MGTARRAEFARKVASDRDRRVAAGAGIILETIDRSGAVVSAPKLSVRESEDPPAAIRWGDLPKLSGRVYQYQIPADEFYTRDGLVGLGLIPGVSTASSATSLARTVWLRMASLPFAKGVERASFYARDETSGETYVCKKYYTIATAAATERETVLGPARTAACRLGAKAQTIARWAASEYSVRSHRITGKSVTFVGCSVLDIGGSFFVIEPRLNGHWQRFNNNVGRVTECHDALEAFCHWTHAVSGGQIIVCDLQGCLEGDTFALTDPAILSAGAWFGTTDRGPDGIAEFMANHVCNSACRALGLAA